MYLLYDLSHVHSHFSQAIHKKDIYAFVTSRSINAGLPAPTNPLIHFPN